MNTIELTSILANDPYVKRSFLGVRASNHLPNAISKVPACMVVNADPDWKPGSHWLALYIDENWNVEFFDSYGNNPEKYRLIFNFIKRHDEKWKMNVRQLQGSISSTCGQFCIYFLMWRCRGIPFDKIMTSFNQSVDANDVLVTSFVETFLGLKTKAYDVDYVVNQTCKTMLPFCDLFLH